MAAGSCKGKLKVDGGQGTSYVWESLGMAIGDELLERLEVKRFLWPSMAFLRLARSLSLIISSCAFGERLASKVSFSGVLMA